MTINGIARKDIIRWEKAHQCEENQGHWNKPFLSVKDSTIDVDVKKLAMAN